MNTALENCLNRIANAFATTGVSLCSSEPIPPKHLLVKTGDSLDNISYVSSCGCAVEYQLVNLLFCGKMAVIVSDRPSFVLYDVAGNVIVGTSIYCGPLMCRLTR